MNKKHILTLFALFFAWFLLPQASQAHYNASSGRWLNRDPLAEVGARTVRHPQNPLDIPTGSGQRARDGGLYCFVRNEGINAVDPYGLAYYCQTATVYVFVNTSQESFNAGRMLAQLQAVGTGRRWESIGRSFQVVLQREVISDSREVYGQACPAIACTSFRPTSYPQSYCRGKERCRFSTLWAWATIGLRRHILIGSGSSRPVSVPTNNTRMIRIATRIPHQVVSCFEVEARNERLL